MTMAQPTTEKNTRSRQRRADDSVVINALEKMVQGMLSRVSENETSLRLVEKRQDGLELEVKQIKSCIEGNTDSLKRMDQNLSKVLEREEKRSKLIRRGEKVLMIAGVLFILWALLGQERLQSVIDITKGKLPVEHAG
jgi:hypothetical protein